MFWNQSFKRIVLLASVMLILSLAACAPAPTEELREEPQAQTGDRVEDVGRTAPEQPAEEMEVAPLPTQSAGMAEPELAEADRADEAAGAELAPEPALEGEMGGGPGEIAEAVPPAVDDSNVIVPPDQQFESLSAGEIDDNEDFRAYLQYRRDFEQFVGTGWVHNVDVGERHTIQVTTPNGRPVLGAEVQIYDGQNLVTTLRTPATGIVRFFPLAYDRFSTSQSYEVIVQKGQSSTELTLTRGNADAYWEVTLDVSPTQPPVNLDVLFLLDATGSMGDEIAQLKDNILSISAQIEALPGDPDVRYGLVHYRDRGDQYVTRIADFTPDVRRFQAALNEVQAAGGNDEPESLNEALHNAIWDVDWRVENTVSLIFLVADAPPHLDYPQDYDYAQEMMNATQLGIKVHPIASSDLNSQGEYIFRQIAQFTGGHFIFLTYDETPQSSGEPGRDDLSVPEGTYSVEDLDALVVRLIQEELAALSGQ
jgi:hypothetical protein